MTPIDAGRDLIKRGRGAGDDIADALGDVRDSLDDYLALADGVLARLDRSQRRSLGLPLVLIAAGTVGGYLLGRRAAAPAEDAESNGASVPEAEPSMEVATAVEVSRPQPAELDEIVPAAASKS